MKSSESLSSSKRFSYKEPKWINTQMGHIKCLKSSLRTDITFASYIAFLSVSSFKFKGLMTQSNVKEKKILIIIAVHVQHRSENDLDQICFGVFVFIISADQVES